MDQRGGGGGKQVKNVNDITLSFYFYDDLKKKKKYV